MNKNINKIILILKNPWLIFYLFKKIIKTPRSKKILKREAGPLPDSLYNDDTNAIIIVFSKDRAIQLHALIESYLRNVTNKKTLHILFNCSSIEHEKSYNDLILLYAENALINLIKEKEFRKDLIQLIERDKTNKIIFGCDDFIFSKEFNLTDFCKINPKYAIGSLTRGLDLTFCYTHNQEQLLPKFYNFENDIFLNDKIIWKWNEPADSPDWSYPLGVSFYIFDRHEMLYLLKNTFFKAPNSLEGYMQLWLPYFINRFGISYKHTMVSSTPINLVNTEIINNIISPFSATELLLKWNDGFRIKYEDYSALNNNEAHHHKIQFVPR